jgi:TonB-dependent receptor
MSNKPKELSAKQVLLGTLCLAGFTGAFAAPALAQDAAAGAGDEIVVTGFRASLLNATEAKRSSTAFTDSIFAEDIGKFPDTNIAEAVNRIPGIVISREVNGEGLSIAVRGLGTNFTKILLNGAQVAVASTGQFDSQNTNREVDLDLFPTELFSRLDVNKSPQASILEGGAAGTVNLRTVRPFDNPGQHFTYALQGNYGQHIGEWSPRATLIGSWTSPDSKYGILGGLSYNDTKYATRGYETIGFTNANLSPFNCGTGSATTGTEATCNTNGGNGFVLPNNPAVVPANAGSGLVAGTPIDAAFLQSLNPDVTLQQLGDGVLPRLGRPAYFDGTRERLAGLVSMQYRPTDKVDLYLDLMGAVANRDTNRRDMMFEVRNSNFMIPMNVEVDANNVITSGTFAHSRFFLEARPYNEDLDFFNINPGGKFQVLDDLRVDAQLNFGRSVFSREQPTIGLTTNLDSGVAVDYVNTGGIPQFNSSVDLNDPNAGWVYIRLNLQKEKRITETQGAHFDATWGDDHNNVRGGIAYDEASRTILGYNNDANWENYTCRNGYDGTGTRAACAGGPGSAITADSIASYLMPGAGGFIDIDYNRFKADSNYALFSSSAAVSGGAATGASSGYVDEETKGAYVEANGEADWRGHTLRFNAGTRYVYTDQTIASLRRVDPADTTTPLEFLDVTKASYDDFLPSFNIVADVTDNVTFRLSGSRTLTRANPNAMLPNTVFSDPSAQQATQGNPNLAPFTSTNFDVGGEWYTGGEGYFGVAVFNKALDGFTVNGTNTIPFTQLGIDFDTLSETQQISINNRGGPDVATVTVTQQVNSGGIQYIRGYELTWVQPLDVVLQGLGFTSNYTRINLSSKGAGIGTPTGVPKYTYAFTGYYENFGFSGRVSYVYNDVSFLTGPGQDGLGTFGTRFNSARGQWDAQLSYTVESLPSSPRFTLDMVNFTNEPRVQYEGVPNAVYTSYDPGYTVLLGVRGSF